MRPLLTKFAALWLGLSAPISHPAAAAGPVRQAQVITMPTAPAVFSERSGASPPADGPTNPVDAAGEAQTTLFRTHDLSRRWVQFEMADSFAAASMATTDLTGRRQTGMETRPFATLSPRVLVPSGMKDTVGSSLSTGSALGCLSSPYRPSGFLDVRTEARRYGYYAMMSDIACQYGLPVGLFDALIIRESRYNTQIVSAKNAYGLTQLMPGTAAGLGVNRYDVEQNLRGGARYLRQQLNNFGHVHLALAAYNAGPGRVRNGMVPRIAETQAYVENVLMNWSRLAGFPRTAAIANATVPPALPQPRRAERLATVSSF